MSVTLTVNGVSYAYPSTGDQSWGDAATNWASAVTSGMLQKAGGSFTLTAEVDFGSSYGLKSTYLKSRATNPASSGQVRLGNTEGVYWRNAANNADLPLTVTASDRLAYNSVNVPTISSTDTLTNKTMSGSSNTFSSIGYSSLSLTGSIVNADVSVSAAIAYSKLNLATSIVNADISASAAIAYSKLNLATSIVNADISASAAIARSKLAALTASRAMVTDVSGNDSVSATTATQLGYLSSATGTTGTTSTNLVFSASPTFTGTVIVPTLDTASGDMTLKAAGNSVATVSASGFFQLGAGNNLKGSDGSGNATAGNIGEYVEVVVSTGTNFPATATFGDFGSLSLTAGDWDVHFQLWQTYNGETSTAGTTIGISSTSGNSSVGLVNGDNRVTMPTPTSTQDTSGRVFWRVRSSSSGTVYGKVRASYSAGTPQYLGKLWARRVR